MRVLVACECSGRVRDAFIAQGHDAMSCDLQPTEAPGPHYQGDVFDVINDGWDMMIAHPPCTHLAVSGAAWFEKKRADGRQQEGIDLFMRFTKATIPRVCIENPVCIMSTIWREPDQIIQPYYFGDEAQKTTCLWLKNLPTLRHFPEDDLFNQKTHVGRGEMTEYANGDIRPTWFNEARSLPPDERSKVRSQTFPGVAQAFAGQWGNGDLPAIMEQQ